MRQTIIFLGVLMAGLLFLGSVNAHDSEKRGAERPTRSPIVEIDNTSFEIRLKQLEEKVQLAEKRARAAEKRAAAAEHKSRRALDRLKSLRIANQKRSHVRSRGISEATMRQLNEQLLRDTIRDGIPR